LETVSCLTNEYYNLMSLKVNVERLNKKFNKLFKLQTYLCKMSNDFFFIGELYNTIADLFERFESLCDSNGSILVILF